MSDFNGLYDIRDLREDDKSFVLATFLNGLYHGYEWLQLIPRGIFMDNYKKIAEILINSPNVVIKIACLIEDPEVILGYSILSSDYSTIHWVYCKKAWRKKGIGKSLLPTRPSTITHLSSLGQSLMVKFKDITFNPFAIG